MDMEVHAEDTGMDMDMMSGNETVSTGLAGLTAW